MNLNWREKDKQYYYDGPLGVFLNDSGCWEAYLWAPTADQVDIVIYDKKDQNILIHKYEMQILPQGVWKREIQPNDLSIDDLRGYFYQFEVTRNEQTYAILDPYAKSLALWNYDIDKENTPKAAFVNPSDYGEQLSFANIPGYKYPTDAIIYETHVRDFTIDPSIAHELNHTPGTFMAFAERLDYLQDLGVTHIQLLPIMSYYFINESMQNYQNMSSDQVNYNWGYDPLSYFSVTGYYSAEPENPEKRIEELKYLINEIHKRGMGVILDVVYNHTSYLNLFEMIEPNYYHFMDMDQTPRESFGGGRLGSTHAMVRRFIIDSITYWTKEYKVDGFRFDMMGDHDAETIQQAYNAASQYNPSIIMIGEGWLTYVGDEGEEAVQPADQTWMKDTDSVASFSDSMRNELKSGYPYECVPRFISNGPREIKCVYNNLCGLPVNFEPRSPKNVVQYIEAHDNLTVFDTLSITLGLDPEKDAIELLERCQLGLFLVLTSQGVAFIHAGQEYGRTKQIPYESLDGLHVETSKVVQGFLEDKMPFKHSYFINDSYNASDEINRFDWSKVEQDSKYQMMREYCKGLIQLRKSEELFRLSDSAKINKQIKLLSNQSEYTQEEDLLIGYQLIGKDKHKLACFVNADCKERVFEMEDNYFKGAEVIVDKYHAGINKIIMPQGLVIKDNQLILSPLTSVILCWN